MNYYERHLGDYARDTAHLTMIEHGAYGLLLDRCYATEQGIPDGQAHRLARARTREEKAAVDAVLSEFFTLVDGYWVNRRVNEEIDKASRRICAAKENGKRGGRPKKEHPGSENETQHKPTRLLVGSENETQTKAYQTPHAIHQTPPNQTPVFKTHAFGTPCEPEAPDCVAVARAGPTLAGAVCIALRAEGIAATNPAHPKLLALLAAGAGVDAFVQAARTEATRKASKPFAYVLGTVEGQMGEAATAAEKSLKTQRKAGAVSGFYEREQAEKRRKWEEMTGQKWPESYPSAVVIDVEQKPMELPNADS